jgi:hypothetical protein
VGIMLKFLKKSPKKIMKVNLIKKGVWLGFIVSLSLGCSFRSNNQENVEVNDTLKVADRRKEIQGLWAVSGTSNISFRVKGDSLFFFEDPNPVYFDIRQDSFSYYLSGDLYFNKILKLNSDSIVFIENGETIRLYKRK